MHLAGGIWVRLMKRTRMMKDTTQPCEAVDWQEALDEACHKLDVTRPMVLPRHERDWEEFSQTRFLREHFMEDVPFDRMEVEYIDPDAKKSVNERYL